MLAISLLTACPGADREKIALGTLTAAQREHLVHDAIGFGAFPLAFIAGAVDTTSECPKVTRSGDTLSIVGGCTDDDGTAVRGTLTVSGDFKTSDKVTIRADQFGYTDDGEAVLFDGQVVSTKGKFSAKLVTTTNGEAVRVSIAWNFVGDKIHTDPGATVELVGQGYAEVSEERDLELGTGRIELRGLDTLEIDLSKRDDNDCAPATIDGEPTDQVCDF